MTDSYGDWEGLVEYLSPGYTAPAEADSERMILKASELVDFATDGKAQYLFDNAEFADGTSTADSKAALERATYAQVEYWLETGEEHDVLGLRGSLQGGRVQVNHLPGVLGPRTLRYLLKEGLFWSGKAAI